MIIECVVFEFFVECKFKLVKFVGFGVVVEYVFCDGVEVVVFDEG